MDDPEPPHWRHRHERINVPDALKYFVAVLAFITLFFAIFSFCQCLCLLCRKVKGKPEPRPESPPKVEIFAEEEMEEEHEFGPEIDCRDKDFCIYMSEEEARQILLDTNYSSKYKLKMVKV